MYADLGREQLNRYTAGFPDAEHHVVLHLAGLPVHVTAAQGWTSLTWNTVLSAYATSKRPWVRATAEAWLKKLPALVPQVGPGTAWNDVPDDAPGFELALRARTAWLANRMDTWCSIEHSLEQSSGGGAWVAAMRTPMPGSDHVVIAEVQERLDARDWRPDEGKTFRERVKGPVILVGLARFGEPTSEGFDWDLLRRVFADRVVATDGSIVDDRQWSTTSARPAHASDREGWQAMVVAGAPRWLGKGYGMGTAMSDRVCAFGARIELSAGLTLAEIDAELRRLQPLVIERATTALER